ncbi:MAG: sigma-E factor negative regulatory protein RseA [Pseudohongiellaceae bacterium]|jgi:sigma-E factor negative regulatory protein RseA
MSEQLREALSALKDGEADELELRRLLKQSESQEIGQQWQMMHHVSEAVAGRAPQFTQWDISGSVAAAIEQESAYEAPESEPLQARKESFWLKPVAGFAVAASVAVAVVLGTQTLTATQTGITGNPAVASSRVYPATVSGRSLGSVNVSATISNASAPGTGLSRAVLMGDLAAEQRLNRYMLQHTEQSSLNNGQGMINFARVASFEVE